MLTLFAQRAKDADAAAAGTSIIMMIVIAFLVAIAIGIAIGVFYCLTLSKALKQVRPENREMEPGQVWLLLIPFFSIYWNFVVGSKVPASLKAEFRERGRSNRGEDYGANIGKYYAIATVCCLVPILNNIAGIAALILWIMFWIKIAGFSKQLREGGSDFDDGDDDKPRKRSRDDDYDDEEDEAPKKKKRRTDDDDE